MTRPLAYITGNFGDSISKSVVNAISICRLIYLAGYSPICPFLRNYYILDLENPEEVREGREMANELLRRSRIVIVCGDTREENVSADIALAKHLNKPITTADAIIELEEILSEICDKKREVVACKKKLRTKRSTSQYPRLS